MKVAWPIYYKLAVFVTLFALLTGAAFVALFSWSQHRYHQELTQQLHKDLAQYILEHLPGPLYVQTPDGDVINHDVLKATAMNTMAINPAVEVYLLDGAGRVLAHAVPDKDIRVMDIDVSAIHQFLDPDRHGAVLGQNPRLLTEHSIFSAAPVSFAGDMKGYLYVVLASHREASLSEQLAASHIARLVLGACLALMLFLLLSALFAFWRITQPLQTLTRSLRSYRTTTLRDADSQTATLTSGDEVDELARSFALMQARIQQQFDQLNEADQLRRELISNVSHDLRTPLASMQGYLETLLIKGDQLDQSQREHYTRIAHRHGKHLNQLIGELFELSRLDSGQVQPHVEAFSISELVYDMAQDYALKAEQAGVTIAVQAPSQNLHVCADISLIHRVLQNLIDNALKHSRAGGHVTVDLKAGPDAIQVRVSDDGVGIPPQDLPHVFKRFYQVGEKSANEASPPRIADTKSAMLEAYSEACESNASNENGTVHPQAAKTASGAGLGLCIVQRILALHGSDIAVESEEQCGTHFHFHLPQAV